MLTFVYSFCDRFNLPCQEILQHEGEQNIAEDPRELSKTLADWHPLLFYFYHMDDNGVNERLADDYHHPDYPESCGCLLDNVAPTYVVLPWIFQLVDHRRQGDVVSKVSKVKVPWVVVDSVRAFALQLPIECIYSPLEDPFERLNLILIESFTRFDGSSNTGNVGLIYAHSVPGARVCRAPALADLV